MLDIYLSNTLIEKNVMYSEHTYIQYVFFYLLKFLLIKTLSYFILNSCKIFGQ